MSTATPCTGCGQLLDWRATRNNEYIWADQYGRHTVGGAEGEQITGYSNPYTVLAEMSATILAASTGPKRNRTPVSYEYAATYSELLARVLLGHETRHLHFHDQNSPKYDDEVPWCCEQPMRLRPSGWSCRVHT